jgi:hypothetical protein
VTSPEQLTLQLRVELEDVKPKVWRRILVPTSVRLSRLHDTLQVVMGWSNSHMHAFKVGDLSYGMCFDDYPEEEIDERTVTIRHALRGVDRFLYEYDFGDGWNHLIEVEREIPCNQGLKFAVCLAGENACPPEDCGGPGGYERLLQALSDPGDDEHDDFVRWIGGDRFDRTAFELAEVNAALQRMRQGGS